MTLTLSPDELLTTTRAVRRRLDLIRTVEREVIEECLRIAQQAPTASNMQNAHFVVVTDPTKRRVLAELWPKGLEMYLTLPTAFHNLQFDDAKQQASLPRIVDSVTYLADHLHEVPVYPASRRGPKRARRSSRAACGARWPRQRGASCLRRALAGSAPA